MDIAALSMQMSTREASSSQGMKMLVKAKEMMEQQGDNLEKMIDSTEISINDGKSLDIRI